MGIQTAIGCISRIVGPIMGTLLYDAETPIRLGDGRPYTHAIYVFLTTGGILLIAALVELASWRRLVPFSMHQHRKRETSLSYH